MSQEIRLYDAIYEAMTNSYRVIVNKEDPYRLMEQSDFEIVFAHHIDDTISVREIKNMINWWEEEEEYEMCAKLKHIENEIERLSKRYKRERIKNPA